MFGIGLSQYVPYVLYCCGFLAAFLSIFYRVEIGLLFLVPLLPLQNILNKIFLLPYGHNFVDIIIIGMLIGWLFQRSPDDIPSSPQGLHNRIIIAYCCITFFGLLRGSFFLGIDLPLSSDNVFLMDWKNLVLLPVLYFLTVKNVKDSRVFWLLVIGMLISVFFSDFFFYKEFRWVKGTHYSHDMRIRGVFTYLGPNEMGAFFSQYSMVAIGLLLFVRSKIERILLAVLCLFSLYCLLYSFSRAGYLAFVLGLSFLLFYRSKKLLFVFLLLLLFSPSLLPTPVIERIQMTLISEGEAQDSSDPEAKFDPSAQGRFNLWEKAFEAFKAHPILGIGLGSYGEMKVVGRSFDTHNNYLKILAELGLLGFFVYIFLYYLAFNSGWQLYQFAEDGPLKGLGLGFSACVLANMMNNLTHDNWSYINLMAFYWVLWALVVRADCLLRRT